MNQNLEISRRSVIFGIGAVFASAAVAPLVGCTQSDKSRIAALVQILGQSAANIAKQLGETTLAGQIMADLPGVIKAINDWQIGTTPAQTAIQALNEFMNLLYLIPQASPYTALIDLAVTTAEALLAFVSAGTGVAQAAARPRSIQAPTTPPPQSSKDFKKRWNAICKSDPQLAKATI